MINRVRVIMTQEGMRAMDRGITFGYLISQKNDSVYVLEDNKKSIERFSRKFWKPYHVEENHLY